MVGQFPQNHHRREPITFIAHLRAVVAPALLLFAPLAALCAPLVIAVSQSPSSLPLYVAEQQGYFAAEGVQAKLVACVGGQRCLRMMLDGKAGLATVSGLPIVASSFVRMDYVLIATFATSRDDVKLIARKSAGVTSAAQLAGKLVGATAGSIGHYVLNAQLLAHAVDPSQVAMLDLQPDEMLAALRDGEVDAVAVWEPHGWRLRRSLRETSVVLEQAGGEPQSFNLLARRALAGARDAELARLLRALSRAERFIRERPREAQSLLRTRLALEQRFVESLWPGFEFRLGIEPGLVATLTNQARWLLREGDGLAPGVVLPDYELMVHEAPLRALAQGAAVEAR